MLTSHFQTLPLAIGHSVRNPHITVALEPSVVVETLQAQPGNPLSEPFSSLPSSNQRGSVYGSIGGARRDVQPQLQIDPYLLKPGPEVVVGKRAVALREGRCRQPA